MAAGVEGLDRARRAMRRLTPEIAAQVNAALDKGAEEIRSRATAIAPRDTGELSRSLEVRTTLDGFRGTGAVGNFARMVRGQALGFTRFIGVFPDRKGSPGWYAAWVEFGTAKSTAKPFLRPAFFSLRRRALGRVSRAISAGAKQVARGG